MKRVHKRFFMDTGRIIGTFGLGAGFKFWKGYKLEVGITFFCWYLEMNIYRNPQQVCVEL